MLHLVNIIALKTFSGYISMESWCQYVSWSLISLVGLTVTFLVYYVGWGYKKFDLNEPKSLHLIGKVKDCLLWFGLVHPAIFLLLGTIFGLYFSYAASWEWVWFWAWFWGSFKLSAIGLIVGYIIFLPLYCLVWPVYRWI